MQAQIRYLTADCPLLRAMTFLEDDRYRTNRFDANFLLHTTNRHRSGSFGSMSRSVAILQPPY
ncbi:uncharacterized protein PHALS_15150 [Plasmopara halstedii]|uniref:Uncharacterized protein n=1 Tax=Plasmopara halstedii TaxID=4781 RepID=A0A0P1B2S3_PLAHL|nr:uncharacterized protein PHALS_15150 [Plasmopara halstedii]CEG48439.1 hypothetical protein PHALS_15150 [Plasmopara halstedii]|eukprot:XP_024584808.1 hypothetical protein PHALS_15150 [Plasmopara halstedii]